LQRSELTSEAIRLTRQVRRLLPEHGEVAGLLALMLLTDARRAARSRADGSLVPLADQDRRLWNEATSGKASLSWPTACPECRLAPTSSRQPSPRSMTRRRGQRTPTGLRSLLSTASSSESRRTQ